MNKMSDGPVNLGRVDTIQPIGSCMVAKSWDGVQMEAIAKELYCGLRWCIATCIAQDGEGIDGLLDWPKAGRRHRLTTPMAASTTSCCVWSLWDDGGTLRTGLSLVSLKGF